MRLIEWKGERIVEIVTPHKPPGLPLEGDERGEPPFGPSLVGEARGSRFQVEPLNRPALVGSAVAARGPQDPEGAGGPAPREREVEHALFALNRRDHESRTRVESTPPG